MASGLISPAQFNAMSKGASSTGAAQPTGNSGGSGGSGLISPAQFNAMNKSSASATPATTVPTTPTTPQQNNGGGFLKNIWSHTGGAVLNDLRGGLEGFQVEQQKHPLPFAGFPGFVKGVIHPGQAEAQFQQSQQRLNNIVNNDKTAPPILKNIVRGAYKVGTAIDTDPWSLVPIPAGPAVKLASKIPGVVRAAEAVGKVGKAVAESKPVAPVVNQLGKNFVKFHGASEPTKNVLTKLQGEHSYNQAVLEHEMPKLAKEHGLTHEEQQTVGHIIENTHTGPVAPHVAKAAQELKDAIQHGVGELKDKIGTNTEMATQFKGKPILDPEKLVKDYFPHRYNVSDAKAEKAFEQNVKGFSTKGPFNQERTFNTLKDAEAAGLKPELNPYLAVGQRLNESARAVSNAKALQQLIDEGVIHTEDGPGLVESTIPQLRGMYVKPADENALKAVLTSRYKGGVFLNAYDKGLGAWKRATLFNPAVHGHNITYNGMWLGGAKPSYVKEALHNVRNNPMEDEWYSRALKSGAISSDKGGFVDSLRGKLNSVTPQSASLGQKVANTAKNATKYATHGALWDADKAIRTALFRQAVESGKTDAEAAKTVNHFMVDYGNTTPFENNVMTRIFPYYRFMKGNIPLQLEQWINNTPKQAIFQVAKDATSQLMSGQPSHGAKINTGIPLPGGAHLMVDPYVPGDEPTKIAQDGIPNYLFGKVNPLLREVINQSTNHAYYPGRMFAPNDKQSMGDSTIRINGAPAQYNVGASINHAAQNLLPIGGALGQVLHLPQLLNAATGQPQKQGGQLPFGDNLLESGIRAVGSFPSSDNPALDQYYNEKDQESALQGLIKYLYKVGKPVPGGLKHQAYKKIPFPNVH